MSSWSPFDDERYTMSQQLTLMVCSIINCILFGIIPVVMGPCLGLACLSSCTLAIDKRNANKK